MFLICKWKFSEKHSFFSRSFKTVITAMFFCQNLLIFSGFLSRFGRLLATIRSVCSCTWILIYFTFVSFNLFSCETYVLTLNFLHAWRYHWPTHTDLILVTIWGKSGQLRTHIHTKIYTHTKKNVAKTKKRQKGVGGGKKERKEGGKGPKRGRNGEKDGGKRKRGGWV